MGLLKRKPVRKTVTLDSGLAASVEKLSDLSGISQGEIIAKAMDWWKMRMLFALADGKHPLADAADVYACSHPASVTEDAMAAFADMFLELVDGTDFKCSVVYLEFEERGRKLARQSSACSVTNDYVAGHLTAAVKAASPVMAHVADMAERDEFVVADADATRRNVRAFLNDVKGHVGDPAIHSEDYLLKIMVVLFRDFAHSMEDDESRRKAYGLFAAHGEAFGL